MFPFTVFTESMGRHRVKNPKNEIVLCTVLLRTENS